MGMLDPQVFKYSGQPWLLWSWQPFNNPGASRIMIQALSTDGLTRVGSPRELLNCSEISCDHLIENPALVRDSTNGFTLVFSMGKWDDSSSYTTRQVRCPAALAAGGQCDTEVESVIGGSPGLAPGGMSFVRDVVTLNNSKNNRGLYHSTFLDGQRYAAFQEVHAVSD